MATVVRNTHPLAALICESHNALKKQIGAGSSFHLDASEVKVTGANATDDATSIALGNEITAVLTYHLGDALGHKAVVAGTPGDPGATTLAAAYTAANANKAAYNTHIALTTAHFNADETNAVAAADATTGGSLLTLVNAMKAAMNAHLASAPSAPSLRLVQA